MKLHTHLLLLQILVAALLYGSCSGTGPNLGNATPTHGNAPKSAAVPKRILAPLGKEVTFYPTYGYRDGSGWNIALRGWVHEDRPDMNKLLERFSKCSESEMATFRSRSADFLDDDKTREEVIIKFDSDPDDKPYEFSRSKSDGIAKLNLVFTDEKAKELLGKQGSSNGWLTYRTVSGEHSGLGRVRLIEPDPNGVSLVSDIDDTIKITEVPGKKDVVLRNTFCLEFRPVREPDMATSYKGLGDIPIHYVSGGPEQLFGPLYDYLITGAGGFPEGTFHLKFVPKTAFSRETSSNFINYIKSSLEVTYKHKLAEITTLMERFPNRKFILVGDSGEIDPEVYSEIKKRRPAQVKEIWIRDVINDNVVNHFRLEGMTVIPVNPPVCVEDNHFIHLSKKVKEIYPTQTLKRNTTAPCGQ